MSEATRKSLDYQMGYCDGFKEGYNKALEQIQDLIQQANNQIPRQIAINPDPQALKDILYNLKNGGFVCAKE